MDAQISLYHGMMIYPYFYQMLWFAASDLLTAFRSSSTNCVLMFAGERKVIISTHLMAIPPSIFTILFSQYRAKILISLEIK